MSRIVKWGIGCAAVVLLLVIVVIVIAFMSLKTFLVGITNAAMRDSPSVSVQEAQLVVRTEPDETIRTMQADIDAITRTRPVQHRHYSVSAGSVPPSTTYRIPITTAKSKSGASFNPAREKVWSISAHGEDTDGKVWSVTSGG